MSTPKPLTPAQESVMVYLFLPDGPSMNPPSVSVTGSPTNILYTLDLYSIQAGYRFSGYADNTPGTGSQLTGTSVNEGESYQFTDQDSVTTPCPIQTDIKITLLFRNNKNSSITISYDPQIINNR